MVMAICRPPDFWIVVIILRSELKGIETTTLFVLLRKRLKGIQGRELALGMGAALLGTLAMSIVILFWLQVTKGFSPAVRTLGGVTVGAVIYALLMLVLRIPEVSSLLRMVKRRMSR